ncbi:vegetative incompatibility protein HET-E-1 [Trichoderma asperellum]|uniref:Mitochondrial division protein 1 n=1 Tax=Trichoderma asperellum TaxID=101201 RepID=A0A6V8QQ11_TRIAP|nr:vegetative incompatibility protein HET-E-1 [Trichoderma asperellum]
MDLVATHSHGIIGNRFGNNTTIHQGDNHYYSPNDKTREEEDTKCLTHLRTTDPRDDKTRIEDTKGGLFKDSYRWILEHSDFRQWRDNEHSRLLWIKGDPGKGKTMLLCGIVNELSHRTRLRDQKANTLLSYFFCQAADERINSATAVLRGLIYLVVEQQPLLVSHVQKKYKHGGEALFKDANAWSALSEIFSNILEDASLERTYIIIDALDECVTDLPKLLDFISMKSALNSRVKWIVSSRNWPEIEERLDSATQQMRLCLELNEKSISAAVNAYIEHQVKQLAQRKNYDARTNDAVQHHLSSNSNNTFLWILATVLHVYRPVTLAELGTLIESPDDNPADAELIYKAIGLCGSLLTVRDSRVYVIHQSAKDYLSGKVVSTAFLPSPTDVHGIIFSRSLQGNGRYVASGSDDGTIKIWDATTGTERQTLKGHSSSVRAVAFSGNGRYIASGSDDKTIKIWDATTGTERQTLRGHSSSVNSVAFSGDGCYITSGSDNKTIKIWDATTGTERQTLRGHSSSVNSVAFSGDGRYIASGSDDKTIKIWDATTGTERQTLKGHSDSVRAVAFSGDGRYIASGSDDKTIKIWDATTGTERQTLKIQIWLRIRINAGPLLIMLKK